MQNHDVSALDLPIHARVSYGYPIDSNMIVVINLEKFLSKKLCAVVNDDRVGHYEMVDNVKKKLHFMFGLDLRNWSGLDPFHEFVDGHE